MNTAALTLKAVRTREVRDAFRRERLYSTVIKRVVRAVDIELKQMKRVVRDAAVVERQARHQLTTAIRNNAIREIKRVHYPLLCLKNRPDKPALNAARFAQSQKRTMFSEFVRANYAPGLTMDDLSCRWKMLTHSEKQKFHPLRKPVPEASEAVLALISQPTRDDPNEDQNAWESRAFMGYLDAGFQELQSCLGPSLTREQWLEIAPHDWESKTEAEKKVYA